MPCALDPEPRTCPIRLAAEEAARLSPTPGPGSFRVGLLDQLHLLSMDTVHAKARVRLATEYAAATPQGPQTTT